MLKQRNILCFFFSKFVCHVSDMLVLHHQAYGVLVLVNVGAFQEPNKQNM